MERGAPGRIDDAIAAAATGDEAALEALLPQVYARLRALARRYLGRERGGHTLSPTALVHEAYLRLLEQPGVAWQGRAHVVALAARMMRRVLVNHAVARRRVKRGRGWERITIDTGLQAPGREGPSPYDLLDVDAALERLAALDERQARIVELRCFGGLTVEEQAEVLGLSVATVKREWATARLWLARELEQA